MKPETRGPSEAFGVGGVGGRQIDRGQQEERAGAKTERGIGIVGAERQRPLRQRPERKRVERRQRRRFRTFGEVVEIFRRRNRQCGADAVGRRQRMDFGRRIAQRSLVGGRRHRRSDPARRRLGINFRRWRLFRLRRFGRLRRLVVRHRIECRRRTVRRRPRWPLPPVVFLELKPVLPAPKRGRTAVGRGRADAVRRGEPAGRWRLVVRRRGLVAPLLKTRRVGGIALEKGLQQIAIRVRRLSGKCLRGGCLNRRCLRRT